MGTAAISNVIKRLDLLDGLEDGRYPGLDLHLVGVPTGACEFAEGVIQGLAPAGKSKATVMLQNPEGEIVSVDCAQLARNLNRFAEIFEKLPATKLLQATKKGETKEVERIKAQVDAKEFFVYHIVDHFISASLSGIATTDEPFPVVFNKLPVDIHVRSANQLATNFGRPDSSASRFQTWRPLLLCFKRLEKSTVLLQRISIQEKRVFQILNQR